MSNKEHIVKTFGFPPIFRLSSFASVKLTITLLVLIAFSVLVGAWCPQESQVGKEKVIEQFGPNLGNEFIKYGIADIFHTPWFLGLIGLLTVNMIACSVQRVFPKVKSLRKTLPYLSTNEIKKIAFNRSVELEASPEIIISTLGKKLSKNNYKVNINNEKLTAEFGKYARLAATITHIGLLTLLAGVTITSWTGFNGFQTVRLDETMSFADSEHSKLWIGQLPKWKVYVKDTKREDYDNGDPKQWYSNLSVIEENGKIIKQQEISVNNPLTYKGVDIYQSSWGLDQLAIAFNKNVVKLNLRPMGKLYAAFVPLNENTILIFSIKDQFKPLRVFAKIPEWQTPRLLSEITVGKSVKLGDVNLSYIKVIPVTGLQYKSDPGLLITYIAFGFIISGVLLAAIPNRQLWAHVLVIDVKKNVLTIGGVSRKAKNAFEKSIEKIVMDLNAKFKSNDSQMQGGNKDQKKKEQYV
jgi:cytochrome c biogenesis protein